MGTRLLLLAALVSPLSGEAADLHEPQTYMLKLGFSPAELADLETGKIAARVFQEKDDNDAFVIAVARIRAPEERLVDRIRHIETTGNRAPILQIGRFSDVPKVQDLDGLTFDPEDLEDFSKCRVGECEIQAPAEAIELSRRIEWKSPGASAAATRLLREAMVQLVGTYLKEGSTAMVLYNNNSLPVSPRLEVQKILQNSPNLLRYNPSFLQYLLDFPAAPLSNVENFVYWFKQKLRKPVVSVVHMCLEKVTEGNETGYFIAMKHVYDTHYFLAEIEFLTLIPAEDGKGGFYLAHAIRARIDPPQKLRGLLLGKIKGAMKDALIANVEATRKDLEAATP
jgi:hypothetical protein